MKSCERIIINLKGRLEHLLKREQSPTGQCIFSASIS